ncbi:MAG: hypothetical protein ACXIVQ_00205 [Acidimicrobiales bacterium]
MNRSTRIARLTVAAGLVLGSLVPAASASALTPPAPSPMGATEFGVPQPPDPQPNGLDQFAPAPTDPGCGLVCIDDFAPGGGQPGDGGSGNGPGNGPGGGSGEDPDDGGSDSADVESDTVIATPTFTG